MAKKSVHIYDDAIEISRSYLGPAAERFMDRQIRNHLNKAPESLEPNDLFKLLDWIRISVSLLTEDSMVVDEYIEQLRLLANTGGRHHE